MSTGKDFNTGMGLTSKKAQPPAIESSAPCISLPPLKKLNNVQMKLAY